MCTRSLFRKKKKKKGKTIECECPESATIGIMTFTCFCQDEYEPVLPAIAQEPAVRAEARLSLDENAEDTTSACALLFLAAE
jgi:hypothetical protein